MKSETLFASSLQTTDRWLDELAEDMNWTDRRDSASVDRRDSASVVVRHSYHVLGSVLHALRDRLPLIEAVQLAAEMPLPIRGMYFEGWKPAGNPSKDHVEAFLNKVDTYLRAANVFDADVTHAVRAVFRLLDRRVSAGEIEQIKGVLPEGIRKLWPRPAAA